MKTRPKDIGTRGETAVVNAATTRGFPHADRITLGGRNGDRADVRLTIGLTAGVVVQVKAGELGKRASDAQIAQWLEETDRQRQAAGAAVGFLVTARAGIGLGNAYRWWAHMRYRDFAELIDPGSWTPGHLADRPIRIHLDTALQTLRAAGYGDPIRPEDTHA